MQLAQDDLQKLKDIEAEYTRLTRTYGEIRYDQLLLKTQLENLDAEMLELERIRSDSIIELQTKLGATGQVNIETGEFTPDE
jgi:hypothetical protein